MITLRCIVEFPLRGLSRARSYIRGGRQNRKPRFYASDPYGEWQAFFSKRTNFRTDISDILASSLASTVEARIGGCKLALNVFPKSSHLRLHAPDLRLDGGASSAGV